MSDRKIHFYEGERKEVTATVRSKTSNEVVVITSSTFEVTRVRDNTVVQKGTCEISGNEATALLEINQKGVLELKITACVGREVVIEKAEIKVM